MEEVNNSLPYDAQSLPDIAATLKSGEAEKKPQEPLPEVPQGALTVAQAYAFLGVAEADKGQLDKASRRRLGSGRLPAPPLAAPCLLGLAQLAPACASHPGGAANRSLRTQGEAEAPAPATAK